MDASITLKAGRQSLATYTCQTAISGIHKRPDASAPIDDQLLFGHGFNVVSVEGGWAYGQAVSPLGALGYVGYVRAQDVRIGARVSTHTVSSICALVFMEASLKTPALMSLSHGSCLTVADIDGDYAALDGGGYLHVKHIKSVNCANTDPVTLARLYSGLPYLWGGKGADGVDCSGLVQMALWMSGHEAPRDADQQEALGVAIEITDSLSDLKAADLIFWKGHVGLMVDADILIHANGFHMRTYEEPLSVAAARIAKTDGPIRSIRRWLT